MPNVERDFSIFKNVACDNPEIRWFAIADSAQEKHLPSAILSKSRNVRCLLGGSQDSPLARQSPHLVELCSPIQCDGTWFWICKNSQSTSSISIIASRDDFQLVFDRLASFTQVRMPDSETMFFAFWDPAILGTLIGQLDDLTLHVPGPVLNPAQQSLLTEGLTNWWYWDRLGNLHEIAVQTAKCTRALDAFELDQQQVDDLVEASLPDHILYYVTLNQSNIIDDVPHSERYRAVRDALMRARKIGLETMRDMVDFVCLELIFKENLRTDTRIADLLNRVKIKELGFQEALEKFP